MTPSRPNRNQKENKKNRPTPDEAASQRVADVETESDTMGYLQKMAQMLQEAPSTLPAEIAQQIAQLMKVMTAKLDTHIPR